MLVGFSHHHDNPGTTGQARADDYRALSDYMDSPWVVKVIGGARVCVNREPVPEILYGRAEVLRRQIAALPFQRKYRFGLLSFEESDIDVVAFNSGDPRRRREIDLALALFVEALWPGVPADARPMPYVTTHTHTGRLEINLAHPRAVHVNGRAFSHNPDPPTRQGEPSEYWRSFRDLLNLTFGWADPEDPARRLNFARPDWEAKLLAEGERAGLTAVPDRRDQALYAVWDAVQAGEVFSREDVLAVLDGHLAPAGWRVLSTTDKTVTIGAPGAPPKQRLRLKGRYFAADFDGRPENPDPEAVLREKARRLAELETAPARFQAAWEKRAAYNRERYGRGGWPEPAWSMETWLGLDRTAAPALIPRQHHLMALSPPTPKKDDEPDDTFTLGFALPRPDGPDRADAPGPDRGTHPPTGSGRTPEPLLGRTDRSAGGDERSRRYQLDQLERRARALAGPVGLAAVIGRITRRLRDLTVRAGGALAGSWLTHVITPGLVQRFTQLATNLETLNARYDSPTSTDGRLDAGHRAAPASGHPAGGDPAVDGPGGAGPSEADGRGTGPDRRRAGNPASKAGDAIDSPVGTDPHRGDLGDDDAIARPAPERGGRKARRIDLDHGGDETSAGGPGLTLGAMLGLGRDLAQDLGVERVVTLTRIQGGLAFQAPGMAFALLADRVLVIHWTRAPEALRRMQDWLTQRLGDAFPIEDMRTVAATAAAGRVSKPQGSAADRTVPEAAEPDRLPELEEVATTPTSRVDDDFAPGL